MSFSRTLTEADVALFIGVTWDVNPYHTDEGFLSQTPFKKRIAPGLLTASLLTHLGGLWAFLATDMRFEFLDPVYINETVTARAEVAAVDEERGLVTWSCEARVGERLVLRSTIKGFPGRLIEESD